VASNGQHLLTIINEILDISRIEADACRSRSRVSRCRPRGRGAGGTGALIRRSKLAVTTSIPDDLNPISSDRQKVKQILLNLLSNAIKFTPKGSVEVSAERLPAQRAFCVNVADTGIGIAPVDSRANLRRLQTARQLADPCIRRHRPRLVDLPPPRTDDRR